MADVLCALLLHARKQTFADYLFLWDFIAQYHAESWDQVSHCQKGFGEPSSPPKPELIAFSTAKTRVHFERVFKKTLSNTLGSWRDLRSDRKSKLLSEKHQGLVLEIVREYRKQVKKLDGSAD